MKSNRKLDDKEVTRVSGGGWGPNDFPKSTYHDAGFITKWTKAPIPTDRFLLRLDGLNSTVSMFATEAKPFVDYFLSNTKEEYIKYVQKQYPEYHEIYRGFDVPMF